MTRRNRIGVLILVTGALTPAGATAADSPSSAPADRPARHGTQVVTAPPTATQQLSWLVSSSVRAPISPTELSAHISRPTLRQIGGPAVVNHTLAQIGALTVVQRLEARSHTAEALIRGSRGKYVGAVTTDASGLIVRLTFTPYLAAALSWRRLDSQLRTLAPQVGLAAAQITSGGGCRVVHGVDANRPRPIGSAFKLYVLGALGQAIADRRARWDERLRIRDAWKSLPSGVLQDDPAGTALTLRTFADLMISISDNTAADHLLHDLGRGPVELELQRFGNRHAQLDAPLPTTRELFVLKGDDFPAAADHYLSLSPAARRSALTELDLGSVSCWTTPRDIDSIEWFASPSDRSRVW